MIHEMKKQFGRALEGFKVGDLYRHWPGKTVTESDNNLFCLLTMNHHPVHLDLVYCEGQQHGKVLVVGTYVLSLVVGMTVSEISGQAIANLEYEKVTHDGPVFIGDTIRAETEVLEVRRSKSRPDRGIVYVETRAFNQRDEKVLTLRRRVLIPSEGGENDS
jgi:acyl dehydratase